MENREPSETMRILLITDGIWPFVMGGMQKHSFYLAKFLSAAGAKVHVVHCATGMAQGAEWERPEFKDLDAANISFQSFTFPTGSRMPGHYIRESKEYSNIIYSALLPRLAEFDVVYCQGFTGWAFVDGMEQGAVRIPVLSNLHGYEMFQQAPSLQARLSRFPLRRMAKRISTGSTAVFSFGGKITDILLRIGVKKDNILECPIGIDQRWLHGSEARQRSGKIVFAFVGRDERRKGVHELSVALVQMATTDPAFHFHFIGPIAEGNKLEAKNITYHGSVANEERIREVLREADVLLCPSYSEGMPTVIMEAMASGLAVIATDVGAISQQVGANGWLIPDPRPASIRAAMEEAIALPDAELVRMKQRSMDKVRERFIWGQVIERKLDLMRRFVAESTR